MDGIKYEGMPIFKSIKHCHEILSKMELEWQCMCPVHLGGNKEEKYCKKAHYPHTKYPEYY